MGLRQPLFDSVHDKTSIRAAFSQAVSWFCDGYNLSGTPHKVKRLLRPQRNYRSLRTPPHAKRRSSEWGTKFLRPTRTVLSFFFAINSSIFRNDKDSNCAASKRAYMSLSINSSSEINFEHKTTSIPARQSVATAQQDCGFYIRIFDVSQACRCSPLHAGCRCKLRPKSESLFV
jgi:hypothetical protein